MKDGIGNHDLFLSTPFIKLNLFFVVLFLTLQLHSLLCNCSHNFVPASLISEVINGSPLTSAEERTCIVFASVAENLQKFCALGYKNACIYRHQLKLSFIV